MRVYTVTKTEIINDKINCETRVFSFYEEAENFFEEMKEHYYKELENKKSAADFLDFGFTKEYKNIDDYGNKFIIVMESHKLIFGI